MAPTHSEWVLGFADAVWWSRLAQPTQHAWADGKPLRLLERTRPNGDPDPKAIACYGLLRADTQQGQVDFGEGRPVSPVTTAFLRRVCDSLRADGKKALLLGWDNASCHLSQEVRGWLRTYNRHAKLTGGVRLIVWHLPIKSPWLNRIEPPWIHAKRAVVEPGRLLSKAELIRRIYASFNCQYAQPLPQIIAKKAA